MGEKYDPTRPPTAPLVEGESPLTVTTVMADLEPWPIQSMCPVCETWHCAPVGSVCGDQGVVIAGPYDRTRPCPGVTVPV